MKFPEQFFITGTDTGVGKTIVAAILMAGLGYSYWKPVQSGLQEATDTETVKKITGLPDKLFLAEGYRLHTPLSPHASATIDGIEINLAQLSVPVASPLIVEGAGGVMVPLNDDSLMIDLIRMLGIPVLLVARSGLGTINHTLLTLAELRRWEVDVLGVVLNGEKNKSNYQAIEHYGATQVVALEPLERLDPQSITAAFKTYFRR